MNNKGQTLIMFLLLLPLIAIIFVYALKNLEMVSDHKTTNGLIVSNMEIILNNDIRDVERIKEILGDNSSVTIQEDKILIRVDKVIYCGDYITKTYQKGGC